VPVLCGRRGGEGGADLEGCAEDVDGPEVAGVGEPAGERADEEDEEELDRADPGDVGGWTVQGGGVVRLEDAEGVDHAPGVHDDEVSAEDCEGLVF
jgi:hypothetical protein